MTDNSSYDANYNDDVDDQSAVCITALTGGGYTSTNYTYDEIGNLKSDKAECIREIFWTVDRKVKTVSRDISLLLAASKTLPDLEYIYDATRRRICKITKPRDVTTI